MQPVADCSATPAPIPTLATPQQQPLAAPGDPILCNHCGRTASNGISCVGACVADSGY